MSQPMLLDVNVPMYAAGQAHPLKAACVWVMNEIVDNRFEVVIDTETIQEVLYRYGALKRWRVAAVMAESLFDLAATVLPVRPSDARLAIDLFARYAPGGVTARDLIHAAVMQTNSLTHIISVDKHFDQIESVTRLNPQVMFANAG